MLCTMERRFFDRCDSSRMTKLTCSSCRRRTATSALNAKLGTETLITNVSRRRKDSLRLLLTNGPAFDIVPHTAKHERRSAVVALIAPQRSPHQG
jgi:hypothetical protein